MKLTDEQWADLRTRYRQMNNTLHRSDVDAVLVQREQPAAQDADVVGRMIDAFHGGPTGEREAMNAALAVARRGMVPVGELEEARKDFEALDEQYYRLGEKYEALVPAGERYTKAEIEEAIVHLYCFAVGNSCSAAKFAKNVLARLSPPKPKTAQERVEEILAKNFGNKDAYSHSAQKETATEIVAELEGK